MAVDGPDPAFAASPSSRVSPSRPSGLQSGVIPQDIAEQVLRMGRVEWGAVGPKTDAEHVSDFRDSLTLTRKGHKTRGKQHLHGLYLEGSDTVLCHTGTSPNSAANARALAGIWNWLVEQSELAREQVSA